MRIVAPGNTGCWDNDNDPSFKGLSKGSELKKAENIPVYEYGIRVAGIEPEGTVVQPSPTPTIKPTPLVKPTPTSTGSVLYGDVDGDGYVDSLDVSIMKRFILRKISSIPNPNAADVNLDGSIDSLDLSILKRFVLRKIKALPV